MTAEGAGIFLDYSKHRVTDETLALLLALARVAGVEERRTAMFAGERINTTEDRAVLHTALRAPARDRLEIDGTDVVADVASRSSTEWPRSRCAFATASGRATPASRSGT